MAWERFLYGICILVNVDFIFAFNIDLNLGSSILIWYTVDSFCFTIEVIEDLFGLIWPEASATVEYVWMLLGKSQEVK